jgi:glycerate 2-kinase
VNPPTLGSPSGLLVDLYAAAVRAAAPGPALAARLAQITERTSGRIWLLALGKAAVPMSHAAVEVLHEWDRQPAGGLVVAPSGTPPAPPLLPFVAGDHPEPGPRSLAAAQALGATVSLIRPDDEVWLLLSGGTTSLVGAPIDGIAPAELATLYTILLGSGLDIAAMNRIRKRFSRWGAGRLARAVSPARVRVYAVSDVIGDDLASIGSGPCAPDASTAAEVRRTLDEAGLWDRIPDAARRQLAATEQGTMAETPKPGDRAFARVSTELIASNRLALEAAASRAAELGLEPVVTETPLAGEAAAAGSSVAATLLHNCAASGIPQPGRRRCLIWGGETTVSLGPDPKGLGGRCQEFALAAAQVLAGAPSGCGLLAAGTDGRDGPTDAAGAIVDAHTWRAIELAGRNPLRDLMAHDAYHSLDAAGALFRPGLTGTNVMDVVIGIGTSGEGRVASG